MLRPMKKEDYDKLSRSNYYNDCLNKIIDHINARIARKPPYNLVMLSLRDLILFLGVSTSTVDMAIDDIVKAYREEGWVLYKLTMEDVVTHVIAYSEMDWIAYLNATPVIEEQWTMEAL